MLSSFLGVAAALVLAASSVSGKYISTTHYNIWYGKDFDRSKGFDSNIVAGLPANTEHQVGAFKPSASKVALLTSLVFPEEERAVSTHIFNGIIHVPPHRAGVYRFRITSDDNTDMFLDGQHVLSNPGVHPASTKTAEVHLQPDTDHQFELWWGNVGGPSALKVEVCRSTAATLASDQRRALFSEDDNALNMASLELLTELEDDSRAYFTDLSRIFVIQDVPTVTRCDYEGYWDGDLDPSHMKKSTAHMPVACVEETGGVVQMAVPDTETFAPSSYIFTMNIKARATGLHTFWTLSDDGSAMVLNGGRVIVENRGVHGLQNRSGRLFLRKDNVYTIQLFYGNYVVTGLLTVHWSDPLTDSPQSSFVPLLL